MNAIFEVLEKHLGDGVQGLPSPQAILDAGDVDELREKELRRKREQALKEEFAAKRIRVVDELGRSYATGGCGGACEIAALHNEMVEWTRGGECD